MLEELVLRNIGVIEHARLTFGPGLSVITGETGAGKTMVLTGLGLLLGRRADPAIVRHGATQGEVEGVLAAHDETELRAWVAETGGVLDDGALLVGRVVPAAGRARAFLGGRAVPAATLADLGGRYVTVHGQADQQRLRSTAHQRAALDDFAVMGELLTSYRVAWDRLQRCRADLTDWEESFGRLRAERAHLTAGIETIDAVAPHAGEDDELRLRTERLSNAEDLRVALEAAYGILSGAGDDAGILDQIGRARHALAAVARFGHEFAEWAEAVGQANSLLSQVANDIGIGMGELDADPRLIDSLHARRADLAGLMRQFGPTLDDVLAWADHARTRLAELQARPGTRAELEAEAARALADTTALAGQVSARRRTAASALAALVNAELAGLAMKGARLGVGVEPAPLGPWGGDDVAITLVPHPGSPALPVASSASGGELSRIMLALEVALARQPGDHTFVFDEVDAGVGGSAAVEVGRRLHELAAHHQVIVVTHLPQVAAFADHHVVVTKQTSAAAATTVATPVVGADRERELARMLAGDESPTALRHAKELLARVRMGP